ncbi:MULTISPECIES: arsenate reductase/protein-tyrosine-phosphatase family protein [Microbacterium]|uniref:arsenate reductase/protein-tyrosine-phosphatase family protein n=1 Tax=Microbacterium TaxID=33882 RepID=UPI000B944717|nr:MULTISPECIES: low molecular weight phosphatase family protein [Microbacterium]MDQ1218357.1 protein-tyrosine phosphatase [Microbacterium arborescens]OYC97730.1 low molecular weight phosphatase family protein [Microbacterium sp. Yaish 1]
MIEIATICTGNICRSPLAALLLQTRLAGRDVRVASAGTRGLADHPMTAEAQQLALARGVAAPDAAAHRARFLTEQHLGSADLVLAMAREHRRAVAELVPARTRVAFTVREFGRLAASLSDTALRDAVDAAADQDAAGRLRAAVAAVAGQRGLVLPPADPADDDVIDPYRRSWATYETSAAQLDPAIDQVVRVVEFATATTA